MNCKVCGKHDENKPMCFRGEPWCSEWHRKIALGLEVEETKNENAVVE